MLMSFQCRSKRDKNFPARIPIGLGGGNNERPFFERDGGVPDGGGNFNRGDRMRGAPGGSDGRNRGPRQNWKDNDDSPFNKNNRNNRRADNHRDNNRKSSRWGTLGNSPKDEENWNAENANSPPKAASRNRSDNNDPMRSNNTTSNADDSGNDAQANDSHERSAFDAVKDANPDQDDGSIAKNSASPNRKVSANARNSDTNQGNTTPLHDEPADVSATQKNENQTFPSNNNNNTNNNNNQTSSTSPSSSSNVHDGHVAEVKTINTD